MYRLELSCKVSVIVMSSLRCEVTIIDCELTELKVKEDGVSVTAPAGSTLTSTVIDGQKGDHMDGVSVKVEATPFEIVVGPLTLRTPKNNKRAGASVGCVVLIGLFVSPFVTCVCVFFCVCDLLSALVVVRRVESILMYIQSKCLVRVYMLLLSIHLSILV